MRKQTTTCDVCGKERTDETLPAFVTITRWPVVDQRMEFDVCGPAHEATLLRRLADEAQARLSTPSPTSSAPA